VQAGCKAFQGPRAPPAAPQEPREPQASWDPTEDHQAPSAPQVQLDQWEPRVLGYRARSELVDIQECQELLELLVFLGSLV
jgi:hypothetical protein